MFNYFVPISLLVLGGFTLGLLVGWITWVWSKEPADRDPREHETPGDETPGDETPVDETPDDEPEPAPSVPDRWSNWSVIRGQARDWSVIRDQEPDWSPSDLPFWQMKEVSIWRLSDAGVQSSDIDA